MEQHPIPQDVTGFQFKLIGSMTIKQFAYVATGVILAVILYYLPLKTPFGILFKIFFIPLFGSSGFLIAFLPVEGRPVDIMAANFVKSLFTPNQYVYHKREKIFSFTQITTQSRQTKQNFATPNIKRQINKERELQMIIQNVHGQTHTKLDDKETDFLKKFSDSTQTLTLSPQGHASASQAVIQTAPPVSSPKATTDTLEQQEALLTQQLDEAKKAVSDQKQTIPPSTVEKVSLLEKQIQTIHAQKQQLEQELHRLQSQLTTQKAPSTQTQPPLVTQPAAAPIPTSPQYVRTIPQGMSSNAGLPNIADVPNVLVGIVKDPRSNVLPNILVEVKDKGGNPVRAFKTNPLGQFVSATPLSPGSYTIELEDPKKQHKFDSIQIIAENKILLPIEIISHDAREELRKQLFN